MREAILRTPESAWQSAIDAEGEVREGAWVTELTDEVDLSAWPEGTRLIVRRERPHPGAQFQVFDAQGYRHTAFITDQDGADIAALELRHRRRAKVEDEIRCGKETGMRNLPFAAFEHNRVWLELSLIAQELLAWARALCLEGELALAEPKRLRQRLLHVAGKVVRSARRTTLRLPRSWPWAEALVAAFARLRALPAGRVRRRPPPSRRRRSPSPPQGGFSLRRMLREGDAKGPADPEKRHGAVPVNRPVAVTCLKRANYTCRGENAGSGLVLLDLADPDRDARIPEPLSSSHEIDRAEEGQAVGLLGALAATEDHEGHLDLFALAELCGNHSVECRVAFLHTLCGVLRREIAGRSGASLLRSRPGRRGG